MSKHTPGPWAVVEFKKIVSQNPNVKAGCVDHYELVAIVQPQPEHEHLDANAALIAAAPDMFAALSDLVVAIERAAENGIDMTGHVGLGAAFAAIRKAQGRD